MFPLPEDIPPATGPIATGPIQFARRFNPAFINVSQRLKLNQMWARRVRVLRARLATHNETAT